MESHHALRRWWTDTGADIRAAGASDEAIVALEGRYDLVVPEDFRAYLRDTVPAADNWDEEMGNWWPVARLRTLPEEYPHPVDLPLPNDGRRFLFFLDHCVWCWAWAISCEDDETRGQVMLIGGNDRIVAHSFTEFVARYTADWMSVA